ncbi:E3 ubiquitin-protein ligase TM129-like [Teleopsis dalmanni]|uniref:E3 ubiquitin-protein ligase TM129-like n=1 Tax=Teleopsis dalmanni TaxID=139649 RepID=UPI0018CFA754|nr:E3 ubiquitin-protein ligase TM129-like [Teleopsis dalmanni]XP_037953105.1 E3 ubiquitin-protein ligase TM129-like [Teleopsis dalmanni]
MDESELLFNLFYILLCMCIVFPPEEFQRLGFTIEEFGARLLGDEKINFILYHQRRTCLNLFVHSCLPAAYFLIHQLKFSVFAVKEPPEADLDPDFPMPQEAVAFKTLTWKIAQRFSLIAVLAVPAIIFNWKHQNWKRHPISLTLNKFSNGPHNYLPVATDISAEFRRYDIYKKKLNSISTVIATQNWIIKTSLYNVNFAHQSDTSLSVAKTETYNVSQDSNDTLQMISIKVKTNRQGIPDFNIRINALEFRNLEERITRPISIPANIQFHRNVVDRFVDVFKEHVALNPIYKADLIADKCFACMVAEPNIKIRKQCEDVDNEGRPLVPDNVCSDCYCRPMWCVECLARWFAARQNEFDREVWLEQKCSCPMCRAKFCILDVSYIERRNNSAGDGNNIET